MDYKVYLCDRDLDSNICIASFSDFTALLCCVPSICLCLNQQGYKTQEINLYISGCSFFTISLSNFKYSKQWCINTMTSLQQSYDSYIAF